MMIRSYLFSPGDDWRKIEKGARSTADAVIIDLEDAVAPSQKVMARGTARKALLSLYFGDRQRLVRINSLASGWLWDDLIALLEEGLVVDGLVLPKVEHPDVVQKVAAWLQARGYEQVALYALIESAMGVLNVGGIAGSSPMLKGLMLGGEDLVASLGARATAGRQELLYARGAVVTAAAAYGLQAIDVVYLNMHDLAGFRAECDVAMRLGFSGKMVIHPRQIAIVNEVFSPSEAEIEWATNLLTDYQEHLAHGKGVFAYHGEMIDEAIVKRARHIMGRVGG